MLIDAEGRLRFDGREMLMVHDVFRREFALMPALVRGVAVGDRSRAQIVTDHIECVSSVLHHHHSAEDQYTWPLLLDRCGSAFAPVVQVMEIQHGHIASLGREVDAALASWRTKVSVESREALAGVLERLLSPMKEHLREEEQRVVPLLEEHITAAEWDETMQKGAADVDAESLPLSFGLLMYEGDPQLIERTLANLPADARLVIRELAAQAYAEHSRRVHGTPTPPRSTEL
jgi:hemerythrin-like domain-containing protein